jgi:hypothetical protein
VQSCEGLPNVRFLDLQPMGRLNDLLGLADIHLLPQRSGAADLVMPSKLTGMLASGRAILATASPETQLAYALEGCGLVVPSESPEMMAEGLRRLADDAPLRERLGTAARLYAEQHLDKEQVLTRLMEKLQLVCDGINWMAPMLLDNKTFSAVVAATPLARVLQVPEDFLLPETDAQHAELRWWPIREAQDSSRVHHYTKEYFQWQVNDVVS